MGGRWANLPAGVAASVIRLFGPDTGSSTIEQTSIWERPMRLERDFPDYRFEGREDACRILTTTRTKSPTLWFFGTRPTGPNRST